MFTNKQLMDDLKTKATQYGAIIHDDLDDATYSYSDPDSRELVIGKVKNELSYFIAMHELGHIVLQTPVEDRYNSIELEAQASQWARDHSIIPWNDVHKSAMEALMSYMYSGDFLPDHTNKSAFWDLLSGEDKSTQNSFMEANSESHNISDDEYHMMMMLDKLNHMAHGA